MKLLITREVAAKLRLVCLRAAVRILGSENPFLNFKQLNSAIHD